MDPGHAKAVQNWVALRDPEADWDSLDIDSLPILSAAHRHALVDEQIRAARGLLGNTDECLTVRLRRYFGEAPSDERCGRCSSCFAATRPPSLRKAGRFGKLPVQELEAARAAGLVNARDEETVTGRTLRTAVFEVHGMRVPNAEEAPKPQAVDAATPARLSPNDALGRLLRLRAVIASEEGCAEIDVATRAALVALAQGEVPEEGAHPRLLAAPSFEDVVGALPHWQ